MKRYALSLALTLGVLEFSTRASAQTDSSRYDIGYLTLNKDFTQHISIRGEDLEKMPFTNLSDAIRAWLFGAYTGQSFLAYVVDGNPVMDVNLYPIYDIEEVTYISNAVATAAYGGGQKGLVLITTRRGKRPAGMRVTAQTGLVKGNSGLDDTHTNIYHQYYLGAYKNMDKVSFGVSEDWQRDILPMEKRPTLTVNTPNNLRRWRTNGWLDWRPDQRNTIGIRLGYMDQEFAEGWTTGDNNNTSRETNNQHTQVVIPELSW
ncbi:MAG TPA: hypothetical protein VG605_08910, partial [Puia sp.]|nr:hypothetical protein [Puia sp.]